MPGGASNSSPNSSLSNNLHRRRRRPRRPVSAICFYIPAGRRRRRPLHLCNSIISPIHVSPPARKRLRLPCVKGAVTLTKRDGGIVQSELQHSLRLRLWRIHLPQRGRQGCCASIRQIQVGAAPCQEQHGLQIVQQHGLHICSWIALN